MVCREFLIVSLKLTQEADVIHKKQVIRCALDFFKISFPLLNH